MTTGAERYLQAYPDLALRDAADGIGDPLAHHVRTGEAEGRVVPPDIPASLHWSDRVTAELMPEAGLLYRLGVIASCRWAASAQLGDAAVAAGDVGSLERVSALLPDATVRRVFVEATFDDCRLRLWEDDLTPRLRWADPSALDVAAIRAELGRAGRGADPARRPGAPSAGVRRRERVRGERRDGRRARSVRTGDARPGAGGHG